MYLTTTSENRCRTEKNNVSVHFQKKLNTPQRHGECSRKSAIIKSDYKMQNFRYLCNWTRLLEWADCRCNKLSSHWTRLRPMLRCPLLRCPMLRCLMLRQVSSRRSSGSRTGVPAKAGWLYRRWRHSVLRCVPYAETMSDSDFREDWNCILSMSMRKRTARERKTAAAAWRNWTAQKNLLSRCEIPLGDIYNGRRKKRRTVTALPEVCRNIHARF